MKRSTFGALAAGAALGLLASAGLAPGARADQHEKACYRPHCGKSVKGHEGKCGGTRIDALADEASCTAAGGAWTTAAEAEKLKEKKS
jgi:hypothetical protein